jgi:hypothetical protein
VGGAAVCEPGHAAGGNVHRCVFKHPDLLPALLSLLAGAGMSELHFGIIASVNADMGNITPPFGLNLFIAGGAFGKTYVER